MATTTTTTTAVKVGSLDIQFGDEFDKVKANQLVQTLQQVIAAVNKVAQQGTATATTVANPTPTQFAAGGNTVNPQFTFEGLTEGTVLTATGADSAAFEAISLGFQGLAGVDPATFADPVANDVIAFENGYWSAVPLFTPLGLTAPNAEVVLMWDPTKNSGAGGFSWATAGTGITIAPGQISVASTSTSETPLTWLDM